MQFCVKVVLLNSSYSIQIGEQSENDNIPQEPENLRFVPVINFFYFAFLIVIIDNIITYNPYSPYYVTKTLANGSAVSLPRDTDGNLSNAKYMF